MQRIHQFTDMHVRSSFGYTTHSHVFLLDSQLGASFLPPLGSDGTTHYFGARHFSATLASLL